jgi:ubiquinone/menaquinone biosynthesis C-methylase UbiE
VGCGDGAILNELSVNNFGQQLYGLEISKSFVDNINGRSITHLKECTVYDGYTIPYKDDMFDLVILSHIVEHLEYPRRLINEAKRVGKKIVIEVPIEDTWRLKKDYISNPAGHINVYTLQSLRVLLESCDLTILSSKVTNPSRKIYKYISGFKGVFKYHIRNVVLFLTGRAATRLFTYHYTVVCEKSYK